MGAAPGSGTQPLSFFWGSRVMGAESPLVAVIAMSQVH